VTRILIIGYGAMGREVERHAAHAGCTVTGIVDVDSPLAPSSFENVDVAIDFSVPTVVVENARLVTEAGCNLVIGATGWYDSLDVVRGYATSKNTGIVWGSNFSVGVQMFFRATRALGMMINSLPEYDVMVHEWHHLRKKDSPSGTALTTARILQEEIQRKSDITTETQHGTIDPSHLHVTSTRGGHIVGKHVVTIDGPHDRLELIHDARDRSAFALGALRSARWIEKRTGFYDFTDVFPAVIGEIE